MDRRSFLRVAILGSAGAATLAVCPEAAIVRLENGIYPLVRSARVKNG